MKSLDLVLTLVGMAYGVLLVVVYFVRNRVTEAFRVDALVMPNPSDTTRVLNLVAGILLVGYMAYSLF